MNRHERRKATARGRKRPSWAKGAKIETINLSDPNLDPWHRDNFVKAIRSEATRLDELTARWFRHEGQCQIDGCDCGAELGDALNALIALVVVVIRQHPDPNALLADVIVQMQTNLNDDGTMPS